MKTETKLKLFPSFLLLMLFSCKDLDIVEEQPVAETPTTTIRNVNTISDESKHQAQSDFGNMLMDQVIYRDSMYILNLNAEAADLNIPDSLYNVYTQLVNELNTLQ
ncbi:hypothetical protein SAMN05444349_10874 [Bacteroides faecichinchillae]|uniref:Uncharacterized protein n=1 Tax=Bacteroides faecichinchillae TaxID=871325 RepID=A0A1M4XGU6_9BACE|nr:hypothetical protein [Bacteroides faecichinchillae]THG68630.1 hypothetical protein E5981_04140 [Bacteroides faecichinchillae]SHE92715.1 hypothetical protein SAMN05444349_10874 [Bacteroides faecichinchillae]